LVRHRFGTIARQLVKVTSFCFFFLDSKFLYGLEQKLGGVIAIRYSQQEGLGDFLWSHSTNSMIIGYMNTSERAPMVYIFFV